MSARHPDPIDQLQGDSTGGDIESLVQAFERRLVRGESPEIESVVAGWEEPEKSKLLYELLLIEMQLRHTGDESAMQQKYGERFPDHGPVISDALAAVSVATVAATPDEQELRTESVIKNMRFLAQGGLGQIYIGDDAELKREAAVKMIRQGLVDHPASCEQFRVEAEVTGRLAHPSIPAVYAIGRTDAGRLYYAMQYVRGIGLNRLIHDHHKALAKNQNRKFRGKRISRLTDRSSGSAIPNDQPSGSATESGEDADRRVVDLRELLQIFISVCHTVGYAHRRGILHRDIKPSNIIHGRFGETMVIDWGLALPVSRQGVFKDDAEQTLILDSTNSSRSSTGFVGTPAFMSPEQAAGNIPLTPASDIFSLGATLYYILTGNPPYPGKLVKEVRQQAINCDFVPVDTACSDLPIELAAICHHALNRSPSDRYQTCGELVSDLNSYLSDRPIQVLPDSPIRKVGRWMRRHSQRVLIALLALLVLAVSIASYATYETLEARAAYGMRDQELKLRKSSLLMAAHLAARTLANKVDVYYRILEAKALDRQLQHALQQYNTADDDDALRGDAQSKVQWYLGKAVKSEYRSLDVRSWAVFSHDGTMAAYEYVRGNRGVSAVGRNFAFRDYFHGLGSDLPPQSSHASPLTRPHNSAAIFSTVDGTPLVAFSVPIVPETGEEPIGVLAVFVSCGNFVDLQIHPSAGDRDSDKGDKVDAGDHERQNLLLVESRTYPLIPIQWNEDTQQHRVSGPSKWSAGIVLHHDDVDARHAGFASRLPRANPELVAHMQSSTADSTAAKPVTQEIRYRDPLSLTADDNSRWIAAFAPVFINSRSAEPDVAQTGWFVLVQQEMVGDDN